MAGTEAFPGGASSCGLDASSHFDLEKNQYGEGTEGLQQHGVPSMLDNAEWQFEFGLCHFYGLSEVSQNHSIAVQFFKQTAKQGHSLVAVCLECCYQFGTDIGQIMAQAVELYKSAAGKGDAAGQ
jgi:TPR repeat protein